MSSQPQPDAGNDSIFEQLWAASQAACSAGDYETACHALQAALARAHTLRDVELVRKVGQEAEEQHELISQQAPDILTPGQPAPHPTRRQGIQRVYVSIVRQAPNIVLLLQQFP